MGKQENINKKLLPLNRSFKCDTTIQRNKDILLKHFAIYFQELLVHNIHIIHQIIILN